MSSPTPKTIFGAILPGSTATMIPPREKRGVVYTKSWVVELLLDLAGYTPDVDLGAMVAVEPAAGDGSFLVAMVERLITSCRHREQPIGD
jgi:adenine-specific DNA-methyltransferase